MGIISSIGNFLQGGGGNIQGSAPTSLSVASPASTQILQPTVAPSNNQTIVQAPKAASGQTQSSGTDSGSSTSSGSTTAATPDFLAQFNTSLGQLNSAYNSLFSNYDQQTQSREQQDQSNYGNQLAGLNTQYNQSQEALPWEYAARGLGSSSFNNDALNYAGQTYNQNVNDINSNETSDLSSLQAADAQAKAAGQGALNQYSKEAQIWNDIPNYYQAEDYGQLLGDLGTVQGQAAGTGSNASFLSNIPTPVQNSGSTQLQAQLQALAGSNTTSAAQNQVAQGLIGNAQLTNPNSGTYFNNYWQNLQTPTQGS